MESFITSLGFGNCEDIAATRPHTPTTPTRSTAPAAGRAGSTSTTVPRRPRTSVDVPDEDGECAEGQRLVGGFKFEDQQIFRSFALGGVVLVLAGAATSVVLALLFNLISDLTGGVRVTVLEEEPGPDAFGLARPRRARLTSAPEPGAIAQSVRAHP